MKAPRRRRKPRCCSRRSRISSSNSTSRSSASRRLASSMIPPSSGSSAAPISFTARTGRTRTPARREPTCATILPRSSPLERPIRLSMTTVSLPQKLRAAGVGKVEHFVREAAARLPFLSRHVQARRRSLRGHREVSQAGRRSLTAPKGRTGGGPRLAAACILVALRRYRGGGGGGGGAPPHPRPAREEQPQPTRRAGPPPPPPPPP